MFTEFKFDKFNILDREISDFRFQAVQFDETDFNIKIQNNQLIVDIAQAGGIISGHHFKKGILFMPDEIWDFSMTVERGGLNNIHLAYTLDHIFMNERTLPNIKVEAASFDFAKEKVTIKMETEDWFLKMQEGLATFFKDVFFPMLVPIFDLTLPPVANLAIF